MPPCWRKTAALVVLPGDPGAGKSTLTAALMLSGWRLLSDEITLIDRDDGLLVGLARPVSLKNASIDVIRHAFPDAVIGAPAYDTHKGTVAHVRPSADSVARVNEKARPAWIIFPLENGAVQPVSSPHSRADAILAYRQSRLQLQPARRTRFRAQRGADGRQHVLRL
jgi:HprK-related kinase A